MIFYLTIKTEKPLTHVPFLDSLLLEIDGEEKLCAWDETDANLENTEEGNFVNYRLKGVSYVVDDGEWEYANGTVSEDSMVVINADSLNWQEDDDAEEFEYEIESFEILDYDHDNNKDVKVVVVEYAA